MNILLISQCSKNALTETRRILDQFAERRGDRTWQTAITWDGLNTLRKLLRKTARKNTAVACHWIRGRNHSELIWIVGDSSQFNTDGAVPTNTTVRNVLRSSDENDWYTGEDIRLLAQTAALLHDLGKGSVAFQERLRCSLRNERVERNLYRHEWVSLRLFQAFVGEDDDEGWLKRLMDSGPDYSQSWTGSERYLCDGLGVTVINQYPFRKLPPLAAAVGWLVLTHHRLPVKPEYKFQTDEQDWLGKKSTSFSLHDLHDLLDDVAHNWNEVKQPAKISLIEPYWTIHGDLPVISPIWRKHAAKLAERLLALRKRRHTDWLDNPYIMHLSRLCLMLADHHYSSLGLDKNDKPVAGRQDFFQPDNHIAANTTVNQYKERVLNQSLLEHLLGVSRVAASIAHALPGFERYLPRLANHRGLRKRTASSRFAWQNKAFDAAVSVREKAQEQGAFIVNMASTGCGKTLGNARILYALSDPQQGMRVTYALGLRTLTLQTGRSYRNDLHLDDDELAILVGGSASRALFEYYEAQAEQTGSASIQDLIEEDSHVLYEGQYADHPLLARALANPEIRKLLSAPVLVCTVDHLTPATEAQRAGRQIAPMLRLMSSDLVLDELDDFDISDLPALTRLVYWAGLLGARVLLSSATLPPSLVEGMFLAYRQGRCHYLRNRGVQGEFENPISDVPCLWVDEFGSSVTFCAEKTQFSNEHGRFVEKRVKALKKDIEKNGPARCGELVPLNLSSKNEPELYQFFSSQILETVVKAHDAHHEICPYTSKQVSFGLVRMANIEPLFQSALTLLKQGAPENYRIHLCIYHSRFPLLVRSAIEEMLDTTLNRRQPEAVYERDDIRQKLENSLEQNHLFVVLGSPVTEVGRDHDYDWAVVEPSSMRSLIQLAGRVQRHRQKACRQPNVFILDTNLRHFRNRVKSDPAFIWPGFESDEKDYADPKTYRLVSHRLDKLIQPEDYEIISARPRIQPRAQPWDYKKHWVDLEHARMAACMLPNERELNAATAWQFAQASLTWILPQQQPFRHNTGAETELVFLPNDNEEDLILHQIHEVARKGRAAIYTSAEQQRTTLSLDYGPRIGIWREFDLMRLLQALAEDKGESLHRCAVMFTTVRVLNSTQGWWYHPVLGFGKKT